MSRETAIELALGERPPATVARSNGAATRLLGKRQTDVARLVAEALSNKQIGARLFISERTVDSHLQSILNKLGFNSRAQIAAWIAGSNPGPRTIFRTQNRRLPLIYSGASSQRRSQICRLAPPPRLSLPMGPNLYV